MGWREVNVYHKTTLILKIAAAAILKTTSAIVRQAVSGLTDNRRLQPAGEADLAQLVKVGLLLLPGKGMQRLPYRAGIKAGEF